MSTRPSLLPFSTQSYTCYLDFQMVGQRPKGQHFVPELHLKHFVGSNPSGMVWTYDKQTGSARPAIPKETATQTNFYSLKDKDDQYFDAIEHWLSEVESKAAPIYEQLINGKIPIGQERAYFSVFLATSYARTPSMIRIYAEMKGKASVSKTMLVASDPEAFEKSVQQYEVATSPIDGDTRKGLREFILDKNRYTISVGRNIGLGAIGLSDTLAPIFFNMKWRVVDTGTNLLISGDNPVARVVPPQSYDPIYGDGGFLNNGSRVTMPLTPIRAVILEWGREDMPGLWRVKRRDARNLNRRRAYFSERFLYSSVRDDGIRRLGETYKEPGLQMVMSGENELPPIRVVRAHKERQ
jgi:hypothetical protein